MTDSSDRRLRIDAAAARSGAEGAGGDTGSPWTLKLSGHLDELTGAEVVGQIEQAVAGGHTRIILDFRDVAFVTSSGFAALVAQWQAARAAGGDLIVLHPPPNINVLFKVLKLHEHITIADSDEDARTHFAKLASLPEPLPADDSTPAPDRLPGESDSDDAATRP